MGNEEIKKEFEPRNPLELRAAFLFAVLFLAMLVATGLVTARFGQAGIYALGAAMGVTDVDPFIMGMTQAAGTITPLQVASIGILVAAGSNNVVKGIYAFVFSDRKTGVQSLGLLNSLGVLGFLPIVWLK